ncbi:glycosyltransferase [Luteolibacter marinus]|uniref:glycosyltransferase n=1 Tax=Luteolibacter marinus TaxID=2776705 RepID=UPI0018696C80|nr:glycosyltransferase [Luteolibacter marinus]
MLLILPSLSLLCAASYWRILGRPRFLPPGSGSADGISVVVPARDEEGNIGGLLDSIGMQQVRPREVIVVDDDSSDRTAAIATEKGVRVLESASLPVGWKGKPWACQQGAESAAGEWLLFLDADVRLEEGSMERIAALTSQPGTVFSICPYHRIRRPYEELSAFFNVIMLAGINAFGVVRGSDEALFGQCLLISKRHYLQVGGHAPVRDEVLENFHLSRYLREQGIVRKCFLGRGSVSMRMFPGGFTDLRASWMKGFASGASATDRGALVFSSVWITGGMLAMLGAVLSLLPSAPPVFRIAATTAYGAYALQCLHAFRLAGNFSPLGALLFPLGLLFYQGLFFRSLIGRRRGTKTRWKNRDVD